MDIAAGYLNTESDLLHHYSRLPDSTQPEYLQHSISTLVELARLVYGLQDTGRIDNGEIAINGLAVYSRSLLGPEIKDSRCYNAYSDRKRHKSESRTYFPDKMQDKLNLHRQRDHEKELKR